MPNGRQGRAPTEYGHCLSHFSIMDVEDAANRTAGRMRNGPNNTKKGRKKEKHGATDLKYHTSSTTEQ